MASRQLVAVVLEQGDERGKFPHGRSWSQHIGPPAHAASLNAWVPAFPM